jgi:hypothetical protein
LTTHETGSEHSTAFTALWIGVFVSQWAVCAARVQAWSRDQRGRTPPVLVPVEIARRLGR